MHSIRKYVVLYLMGIGFLLSNQCFGQNIDKSFNIDSSKTISLIEFNHRVDRATELLRTKELQAISDSDHINIMMCLNTIFMVHKKYSIEKVFTGGRYKELETAERKVNYEKDIVEVYPKYIWNRGMGYYFPKLKMELYGTPHLYAIFNVIE
ncbi:hypothetical protein JN11_04448 [Mucilaginibacter frigoritolerans]|uniref:Uncharacterized protein n=1 Tax=Mucilaginibacter frigoritolerans TaxID=652788 RepID=A0A562TPG9_9SPHI|nr:hypothetical protein [Mucilaginibacter frigoritolerans]TWI95333.1 hypothetical protein JN11_04448 [Mucilaginibacter frigoritolerans]